MKKIGITIVVLLLVAAAGWWSYGRLQRDIRVSISAAELSTKVNSIFPLKRCAIVCMAFSDPQVAMPVGGDKIELTATLTASLGPIEFPGKARLTARPRYDSASASVYLADVAIPEISMAGVPENVTSLVQQHGPLIANTALAQTPVYQIADAGLVGKIAKRTLTDMRVVNGQLELSFRALSGGAAQ
jgi:hypothetical protein